MIDTVSDAELMSSLREIGVSLPAANLHLRGVRRGSLSLRDAVYFTLLDSLERRRRVTRPLLPAVAEAWGD